MFCSQSEVLGFLDRLDRREIRGSVAAYASALRQCGNLNAIAEGKRIHHHIRRSGLLANVVLVKHLMLMYNNCGSVADAYQVFERLTKRNVILWTVMIAGYSRHGQGAEAFRLLQQMQHEGVKTNKVTFIDLLTAFATPESLPLGKVVHAHIIGSEFASDVFVRTSIFSMYIRCGTVEDARMMFNEMPERDVASWNAMISGYAQYGHSDEAFELFQQMQCEGLKPNRITFLSLLNLCTSPHALPLGRLVHAHIVNHGIESDTVVGNALVSMYGRCSCSVEDSERIFNRIPERDVISWTTMIAGYSWHGQCELSLKQYWQMQQEG
eukprot:c14375_g1_i2 orf=138-1109(+)